MTRAAQGRTPGGAAPASPGAGALGMALSVDGACGSVGESPAAGRVAVGLRPVLDTTVRTAERCEQAYTKVQRAILHPHAHLRRQIHLYSYRAN